MKDVSSRQIIPILLEVTVTDNLSTFPLIKQKNRHDVQRALEPSIAFAIIVAVNHYTQQEPFDVSAEQYL